MIKTITITLRLDKATSRRKRAPRAGSDIDAEAESTFGVTKSTQ